MYQQCPIENNNTNYKIQKTKTKKTKNQKKNKKKMLGVMLSLAPVKLL